MRTTNTFGIQFIARMNKVKEGLAPIYVRVTVDAKIAYLTGFSDKSHFNRIFKNVTGKSPSVYRKGLTKK